MSTSYTIPFYATTVETIPSSLLFGRYSISPEEPITVQCNWTNPLIKIYYKLNNIWTEYTGPYGMNITDTFIIRCDVDSLPEETTIEFINLSDNNSLITKILLIP